MATIEKLKESYCTYSIIRLFGKNKKQHEKS